MSFDKYANSVIKIYASGYQYDYFEPWRTYSSTNSVGSGFVIEGGNILTNAHVVANALYLQIEALNSSERYEAEVALVDDACDLAVLTVKDKNFWQQVKPLTIQTELVKLESKVSVVGFPIGGDELSITEGIVSRIEVLSYCQSYANLLTAQVDAAINEGNSGGPVLSSDGKVVGVVHQGMDEGQNIGYVIPSTIVQHFLKEYFSGSYYGFLELGVRVANLNSKAMREKYKLPAGKSGILVKKMNPNSEIGQALKANDVILAINNIEVDNYGFVRLEGSLKVALDYLLNLAHKGDILKFLILRDGVELSLDVVLQDKVGTYDLLGLKEYRKRPDYYVYAGIVLQKLSINYLERFSEDDNEVDEYSSPANLYNMFKHGYVDKEREEVVFINRILACEANAGYDGVNNLIVETINNQKVRSLAHAKQLIEENKARFLTIGVENEQELVVHNISKSENKAINTKYGVNLDS